MADKFMQTRDMARSLLRGSIIEDAASQFIAQVVEYIHEDRIRPLKDYLLETSGRLHQLASDTNGLSPSDMRKLANDMSKVAKRERDFRKE